MRTPIENPGLLAARLIVYDATERFAGCLQTQLRQRRHNDFVSLVSDCRSWEQARSQLTQWPASLFFLPLPEEVEGRETSNVFSDLAGISRAFPIARFVVLRNWSVDRNKPVDTELEAAFREAGAAALLDWQDYDRIVAVISRHLRLAPRRESSLKEEFLSRVG